MGRALKKGQKLLAMCALKHYHTPTFVIEKQENFHGTQETD